MLHVFGIWTLFIAVCSRLRLWHIMAIVSQEWTSLLQGLGAAWQTAVADLSQVLQQPKGGLDVVSVRLHDHEVGAWKVTVAVLGFT